MKAPLKEHMKNMTSFIALMLGFYIFVYYMITMMMIITQRTLELHPSLGFLAHIISSLVILLNFRAIAEKYNVPFEVKQVGNYYRVTAPEDKIYQWGYDE